MMSNLCQAVRHANTNTMKYKYKDINKIKAYINLSPIKAPPCFQYLAELQCKKEEEEPPTPLRAHLNNPDESNCEPAIK